MDDRIINKKKRGFFHSALGAWLEVHKDALITDTLLDERARNRGQYPSRGVRELVQAGRPRRQKARPAPVLPASPREVAADVRRRRRARSGPTAATRTCRRCVRTTATRTTRRLGGPRLLGLESRRGQDGLRQEAS